MAESLKEKRASKRPPKEGSSGSSKSKNSATASSAAPQTHATPMPSPAPIDQPNFEKLHSVQKDWAQREWIEAVNASMKKIVDFLNKFEISTRYRLAALNQKLSSMERQMDYLESQASEGQ